MLTGNRLPFSPDYIVNWGASFTPTASVDATFSVKHVGDVMTSRDNLSGLDAYTLVDGGVTWRRGPLRVTLSGQNLFNSEYYWNGGSETIDPGRPRQVLLTTSVRFR